MNLAGILIVIYMITSTLIFGGLMMGMGLYNHEDDIDCQATSNPYDEQEREINNCKKHCVNEPIWFAWGTHKDCYWDDE